MSHYFKSLVGTVKHFHFDSACLSAASRYIYMAAQLKVSHYQESLNRWSISY